MNQASSKSKNLVVPYFIPMNGCVNRCIYCNQTVHKNAVSTKDVADVRTQLIRYKSFAKDKNAKLELAFYGGTFLNLPPKRLSNLLSLVSELKKTGEIYQARASTTPESVGYSSVNLVMQKLDTIELGVQSCNDRILSAVNRRSSFGSIKSATLLLKSAGINVVHQLMIGLPFETFGSFAETVERVLNMKPDFVRLYPLVPIKKTLLNVYYGLDIIKPASHSQIIERGAFALRQFEKNGIKVIRVGISEFINEGEISEFGENISDYRGEMKSLIWERFLTKLSSNIKNKKLSFVCSESDWQYITVKKERLRSILNSSGVMLDIKRGDVAQNSLLDEASNKRYHIDDFSW